MSKYGWLAVCFIVVLLVSFDTSYAVPPPPVAVINGPDVAFVGQTVEYDGFESYGEINYFSWYLPLGVYDVTIDGPYCQFRFSQPGSYLVTLFAYGPVEVSECPIWVEVVPTTWYVKTDGNDNNTGDSWEQAFKTIQQGIDSAIPYEGGTVTVLVGPGEYSGEGNVNLDFLGKAITVKGVSGYASTIINCQNSARAFVFEHDEGNDSVIDGFTITNGWAVATTAPQGPGGAIYCKTNVYPPDFVGVYASPTIQNCYFLDNTASLAGGAIYGCGGIIDNCLFEDNTADFPDDESHTHLQNPNYEVPKGGALADCRMGSVVTNSTFMYNKSHKGGAIGDGEGLIIACTISNNECFPVLSTWYGFGGGIYGFFGDIINCAISENYASYGGGLSNCVGSNLGIFDCLISGNIAYLEGGGLHNSGNIRFCKIIDNKAIPTFQHEVLGLIGTCGGGLCGTSYIVADCDIIGNTATSGGGAWGNGGDTFIRCYIAGNSADRSGTLAWRGSLACIVVSYNGNGGGMLGLSGGGSLVFDSILEYNSAARNGGGAYEVNIDNCIVRYNRAGEDESYGQDDLSYEVGRTCQISEIEKPTGCGGGLYLESMRVSNCKIYGNIAFCHGGGVYGKMVGYGELNWPIFRLGGVSSSGTLKNCLIRDNEAYSKGGGAYWVRDIVNCTIIENTSYTGGGGVEIDKDESWHEYPPPPEEPHIDYTCSSVVYNLLAYGNQPADVTGIEKVLDEYGNLIGTDPIFAADGWHLTSSSTNCIDMGVCITDPPDIANTLFGTWIVGRTVCDIDGEPRTASSAIDIGCDEYYGTPQPHAYNPPFGVGEDGVTFGLCAYWRFDEESGLVAYDNSVNAHNGVLTNGPSWTTSDLDIRKGALSFDGNDDYILATDYKGICGSQPRTCTAWVKTTDDNGVILSWGISNPRTPYIGREWIFRISNGYLELDVGGGFIRSSKKVNDNQWHHIAVVLANNNVWVNNGYQTNPKLFDVTLYIDAVRDESFSSSTMPIYTDGFEPPPVVCDVTIGALGNVYASPTEFYEGLLDDVRIYDRALSKEELPHLYYFGTDMCSYWKFDETTGSAAADASNNNNAGTLEGFPADDSKWVEGRVDGALQFDGTDDYVRVADYNGVTGTSSRTCTAWVKATSGYGGVIMSWGLSDDNNLGQKWIMRSEWNGTAGILNVGIWGGCIRSQTGNLSDGNWHHVAAVLENDGSPTLGEVKLYVDGVQVSTTCTNPPLAINTSATEDVLLGVRYQYNNIYAEYFKGAIDDVRIYHRALSPEEILILAY